MFAELKLGKRTHEMGAISAKNDQISPVGVKLSLHRIATPFLKHVVFNYVWFL